MDRNLAGTETASAVSVRFRPECLLGSIKFVSSLVSYKSTNFVHNLQKHGRNTNWLLVFGSVWPGGRTP